MNSRSKRALRRSNTFKKAKRQQRIAIKSGDSDYRALGYYKKQNAMDCGQAKCVLCGNPRKHKAFSKRWTLSVQEQRFLSKIDG